MAEDIDFWAPRACFLEPIPQLRWVADKLSDAADALVAGDPKLARQRVFEADVPTVFEYAYRIMGPENPAIHRRRTVSTTAPSISKSEMRMPAASVARAIHFRDGWHCRYCGCRVVGKEVRYRLRVLLPGAVRWGTRASDCHAGFYAITAVPDHVLPHAHGGDCDLDNIVTACWPCNFGRMSYRLEEVGIIDPRSRPPLRDEWDGLRRIMSLPRQALTERHLAPSHPPA